MSRFDDFSSPLTPRPTRWATLACVAVATVLASCGGGKRVKEFQPSQVIAFGDEYSAFEKAGIDINGTGTLRGLRYTINFVNKITVFCSAPFDGTYQCAAPANTITVGVDDFAGGPSPTFALVSGSQDVVQVFGTGTVTGSLDSVPAGPIVNQAASKQVTRAYFCSPALSTYTGTWVQTLANAYGSGLTFGGDYCPQSSGNAQSYATWGAKVVDGAGTNTVAAQVAAHRAELGDGTLVTVFAGQNDIIEAYDSVVAGTTGQQDAAQALMAQRGNQLAGVVNSITETGARVLVVLVPNLGLAPKVTSATAVGQNAALLTALSRAFNEGYNNTGGLRLGLLKDSGYKIATVDAYTLFGSASASVTTEPACPATTTKPDGSATVAAATDGGKEHLLYCTSDQLATGVTLTSHLWADATHLGPIGHASLAALAYSRVKQF